MGGLGVAAVAGKAQGKVMTMAKAGVCMEAGSLLGIFCASLGNSHLGRAGQRIPTVEPRKLSLERELTGPGQTGLKHQGGAEAFLYPEVLCPPGFH